MTIPLHGKGLYRTNQEERCLSIQSSVLAWVNWIQCIELNWEIALNQTGLICIEKDWNGSTWDFNHCFFYSGLLMGAGKSKPKEPGQRSLSLDGTIGTGLDSMHHHLSPAQQTQTPNRSPAVGGTRSGHHPGHAPTNTPELALFGGVDHTGSIISPHRGPLAGRWSRTFQCCLGCMKQGKMLWNIQMEICYMSLWNVNVTHFF